MVQDAENHKADDMKHKEMVDLRNQADALIAQTKKTLVDMADKIEEDEKTSIEGAITKLNEILKDENSTKEIIEEKVKALTEASHKLAEKAYAKEQGEGSPDSSKKSKDDDVIDAEIE